jgi:hypothetical protein
VLEGGDAPSMVVASPSDLLIVPGNVDILASAATVEPYATLNQIEIQQDPAVFIGAGS